MLWTIVNLIMGSLPEEFEFLKIFGVLFILYIAISLFKFFLELMFDFAKSIM